MLKFTDHETYTPLPNTALGFILPKLDEQNIPYIVLQGPKIPIEYDGPYIEFGNGRPTRFCCLKTNIEPESLKMYAEDLMFPGRRQPDGTFGPRRRKQNNKKTE